MPSLLKRLAKMIHKPLVVVCGTTGVGKSKLAIELALALSQGHTDHPWKGARIINADSMQVYAGMDVITNKVLETERQGIEHLLMSFKKPGEQYVVGQWVQDAIRAIDDTHARKQIPIVVGGTSYWIQHLIFPNRLSSSMDGTVSESLAVNLSDDLSVRIASLPPELLSLFNALPQEPPTASTDANAAHAMHSALTALDPLVAARWHWKDTRKVLRSLRIIHETGRKPSDIWNEQSTEVLKPRYRTLCFWLYAETSALHPRLDSRVDDMIEQGLLNEILELRRIALSAPTSTEAGELSEDTDVPAQDYTLGIYQSIGYKEFHDYLSSPERPESIFNEAVEKMKLSTRKYAKRQVQWLRNKLLPAVYAANKASQAEDGSSAVSAYLLDATELGNQWHTNVMENAQGIVEGFLLNRPMPDPLTLSETARKMLTVQDRPTDPNSVLSARRKVTCSICSEAKGEQVMLEEGTEWEGHLKSRMHKGIAARANRQKNGYPERRKRAVERDVTVNTVDLEDAFDGSQSLIDAH